MIFLANRANLGKRTLLSRLHKRLQTQVPKDGAPVEQVWYHTSEGNKVGVRATVDAPVFLGSSYPTEEVEVHVSFDFPPSSAYDFYTVQWVDSGREFMVGWHQDETHMELGECHLQVDYQGETVQREEALFLDRHPLNVFDGRVDHLVEVLDAVSWDGGCPRVPEEAVC